MNFSNFLENQLLLEFAKKGERPRGAIKLDSDDIEFLYQFPPQFWSQAIYQRYNHDLYEALKNREGKRRTKQEEIIKLLIPALETGNFREIATSGFFTRNKINSIKNSYNDVWRQDHKKDAESIKNAAEDIAYYAIEELEPDATEPEPREYLLGKGHKKVKVKAKPFINRLIHKLEKTIGETHNINSGLLHSHKVGLYGFDLANPIKVQGKDTHKTDGLVFPTKESAQRAIDDLIGMNFHRYFGNLPEPNTVSKIPDTSEKTGTKEVQINSWGKVPHQRQEYFKDSVLKNEFIKQRYKNYDEKMPWYLFDESTDLGSIYKKLTSANQPIGATNASFIASSNLFTDREKKWFSGNRQALNMLLQYKALTEGYHRLNGSNFYKVLGQNKIIWFDPVSQKSIAESITNESKRQTLIRKFCAEDFEYHRKTNPDLKGPPVPEHAPEGFSIADNQIAYLPMFKKKIILNGNEITIDMPFVRASKYFRYATERDKPERLQGYKKNVVHLGHHEYQKDFSGHMSGASMHPNQMTPQAKPIKKGVVGYQEKYKKVFDSMQKTSNGLFYDIILGIRAALRMDTDKKAVGTKYVKSILSNCIPEIHDIVVKKLENQLDKHNVMSKRGRRDLAYNTTLSIMQQDSWKSGTVKQRVFKVRKRKQMPTTLMNPAQTALAKKITVKNLANFGRKIYSGGHAFPFNIDKIKNVIEEIKQEARKIESKNPLYSLQYGTESKQLANFFVTKFRSKKMLTDAITGIVKVLLYKKGYSEDGLENKTNEIIKPIIGNKKKTMSEIISDFQSLNLVQSALGTPKQVMPADVPVTAQRTESPVEYKSRKKPSKSSIISRGKFTRNPQDLIDKKDYLPLAHNHLFMHTRNKDTILNLRRWVQEQMNKNLIKEKDYNNAIEAIDHILNIRFKEN